MGAPGFRRVYSFAERELVLRTLLELNRRAKEIYDEAISKGFSENTAWQIADDTLIEAEDLMDNLTWVKAPVYKASSVDGVQFFNLSATGTVQTLAAAGVPAGVSLFSNILSSGDWLIIRAAEDVANNGSVLISNLTASGMKTDASLVANSDDEDIEFILYKKYYSNLGSAPQV